jgi:hypothetical protein
LLPRTHLWRHLNLYLLFQERVHLLFDGIEIAVLDETASEIDACHVGIVSVCASVAPNDLKLRVEQVVSVSSISHSVINYQLTEDLDGSVAVEGQIFTVTINELPMLRQAIFDRLACRTFVGKQTLGSRVLYMVLGSVAHLFRPAHRSIVFLSSHNVVNSFFDCFGTFSGTKVGLAFSLENISVELSEHLIKVRPERGRILPHTVQQIEQFLINLGCNYRVMSHYYFVIFFPTVK